MLGVRRRVGRFEGLTHFAGELDGRQANRKVFEMMIKAGCFDSSRGGGEGVFARRPLHEALDGILAYAQQRRHEREVGQSTLFGGGASAPAAADPTGPEWTEGERLSNEKEALGFYLTGNPLKEHESDLAQLTSHTIADLKEEVPDGQVTLGGVITGVRPTKIKSGRNAGRVMGRFVLEDLTGSLPAILFADHYEQFGHQLEDEAVVVLKGIVRDRQGEMELTVDEIVPLKRAARRLLRSVEVEVDGASKVNDLLRLRDLLVEHAGETPLRVRVRLPGWRVEVAPRETFRVRYGPELERSVNELLGAGAISGRYVA
jgi:DNA polymerase-3 subunit alpha